MEQRTCSTACFYYCESYSSIEYALLSSVDRSTNRPHPSFCRIIALKVKLGFEPLTELQRDECENAVQTIVLIKTLCEGHNKRAQDWLRCVRAGNKKNCLSLKYRLLPSPSTRSFTY